MFVTLRRRRARNVLWIVLALLITYRLFPKSSPDRPPPSLPFSLLSSRAPQIQHKFHETAGANLDRLDAVRDEFLHAYKGYKDRAWKHDELKPVSGAAITTYCGWSSTLIDTLDTLYIMDLHDEFEDAVQAVAGLSFSYAPSIFCSINPFEMTIRHLGGLLSAYDVSGSRDSRLKKKAVEVGEMLFQAFASNGIQCRTILWPRLRGWPCRPNPLLSLARVGSQTLEFLRLSEVSGNAKWAEKAHFLSRELSRTQDTSNIPGLWPKFFDGTCVQGVCGFPSGTQWFTIGSGADSTYEYLPKAHLLSGSHDSIYLEMWRKALAQIHRHMLFQPMGPENTDHLFPALLFSPAPSEYDLLGKIEHLGCFLGGTLALSSRISNASVDPAADLRAAEKLTSACVWAYSASVSGIAPDTFWTLPCPDSLRECPWDAERFAESRAEADHSLPLGITKIDMPEYLLRPETIESVFILYRITGDEVWRDRGWDMFNAIRKATRTRYGHSGIADTRLEDGGEKNDKMESFWLSETLKYFYLLFSDPRLLSLDDWVLNTEGHPFSLRTG